MEYEDSFDSFRIKAPSRDVNSFNVADNYISQQRIRKHVNHIVNEIRPLARDMGKRQSAYFESTAESVDSYIIQEMSRKVRRFCDKIIKDGGSLHPYLHKFTYSGKMRKFVRDLIIKRFGE